MQPAFLDFFPEFLNDTPTFAGHFSLPLIHFSLIRIHRTLMLLTSEGDVTSTKRGIEHFNVIGSIGLSRHI
jgi:hypothetical protein